MVRSPNCDRARFCQGALISKFGEYTVIPCAHAACTHTRRRTRPFFRICFHPVVWPLFPFRLPLSGATYTEQRTGTIRRRRAICLMTLFPGSWNMRLDVGALTGRDSQSKLQGWLELEDLMSYTMHHNATKQRNITKQRKSKKQTDESSLLTNWIQLDSQTPAQRGH